MANQAHRSPTIRLWGAAAIAYIAWWALFQFQGVSDIGYVVENANPSAFHWIWARWIVDWRFTHYAINFMAPALALLLIWHRRAELRHATLRVSWAGFSIVALGFALHILGAKAQQTRLSLLAMMLLLWGIPWFALGPSVGRALRQPFLALMFSMPLNFFDAVLNPLRVVATSAAGAIAAGLGLPVKWAGSLLGQASSTPGGWTVDLANSSSSIYALLSLTLWTVWLGNVLFRADGWRKFWLFAFTPFLFLLATTVRGVVLCLVAEGISGKTALALNTRYPALLLLPCFLLLQIGLIALLKQRGQDVRQRIGRMMKPQEPAAPAPQRDHL